MRLRILILGLCVLLSACSSWELKQRCESTNWFQYSQDVAFQGRYLEEDSFIEQCKGVERISSEQIDLGFKLGREKMCQYPEIEKRGKEGEPVFFKFCSGLEPEVMKTAHRRGLRSFCTAERAVDYGRSGKVYKNVCDVHQEKVFLPPYRKARFDYLKTYLQKLEKDIGARQELLSQMNISESRLSAEYASINDAYDCRTKTVYDEASKTESSKYVCELSSHVVSQRSSLSSQLSELRSEMRKLRLQLAEALHNRGEAQIEHDALQSQI